ncbi:MAG: hypothetical protein COX77_00330 [Candidatus Komeilibacteria bacterium CG_4_10_14_0_2_um_filter_37_10]|uniref:ROK family protein n=1 Tax=Candidatus Komeilibacteria bacterium CG_4_10_14_0_2_um_filter_37_10 TaxID=1974470 RepID=A0A2M7VGN3_9BACT|nr:MAG: hypothetical protein COX77_00330 [Candidatus Komeilibacteria bacterium CG_4_10_14_0_2_um_filter_37_10]
MVDLVLILILIKKCYNKAVHYRFIFNISIMKDLVIGIDVGGTKIKVVLLRQNKVLAEDLYLVKNFKTHREFLATLIAHIELLLKPYDRQRFVGIGIGLPGILDRQRQSLLLPPNLSVIKKINFIKELKGHFNLPVRMENDTKAMALAEMLFGSGRGKKSIFVLSLGTGVGGAYAWREENKICLLTGHQGTALEIGHTIININGVEGSPKTRGEVEQYLSSKFFSRRSNQHPAIIQEAAEKGKKSAQKIYQEFGYYLGFVLLNIIYNYDPEIIVLSGGLSRAEKLFIRPALQVVKENILSPLIKIPIITATKLKDQTGAIGAAALWYQ